MRMGFSTQSASNAAMISKLAAVMNTPAQLPDIVTIHVLRGTSSDAVPLAVYSRP